MPTKNLWGDLPVADKIRTPFSLAREQATFLDEMTHGALIGRVDREAAEGRFGMVLRIVAPSLNNYHYNVFRVDHDVTLYPLDIVDITNSDVYTCEDEGEFVQMMENILTSEKVRRVVTGLLAQIRGEE